MRWVEIVRTSPRQREDSKLGFVLLPKQTGTRGFSSSVDMVIGGNGVPQTPGQTSTIEGRQC